MAKHEVPIEFSDAPRVSHVDEFMGAAQSLAVRNCVYVVPITVESPQGPVSTQERKIAALVWALNNNRRVRGVWANDEPERRRQNPGSDYGMHSNPYDPAFQPTHHYLRWHHTPFGSTVGVFAQVGPAYLEDMRYADRRLTELLSEGLTDPRYADPTSFTRAEIATGESLVFRFDDGTPPQSHPYLHAFTTTSHFRYVDLTDIFRVD